MWARHVQKRLLSIIADGHSYTYFRRESPSNLIPCALSLFRGEELYRRNIHTLSESSKYTVKQGEEDEVSYSLNPNSNSRNAVSDTTNSSADISRITYNAKSDMKVSSRHDLAMIFTCKVCETRSVKTMSRESYEKGVVVARCGGCNNYHLIADHLGIFGEKGSIEDILAARGEEVKKGSADTLNLTLEDLAGLKS